MDVFDKPPWMGSRRVPEGAARRPPRLVAMRRRLLQLQLLLLLLLLLQLQLLLLLDFNE